MRGQAGASSAAALAKAVKNGDARALARAISHIERGGALGRALAKELYAKELAGRVIGFTGPPGAGKSSLINEVAKLYISQGFKVAVAAFDPSSEFTGGAVLGDRARIPWTHERLYVRSLGARGRLGGLSDACGQSVQALDAAGYGRIIIETVGAGQSEIDIRDHADVVVALTTPNLGDDVQMMKAGVLEIGDIFVVSKCDLPGAEEAAAQLARMAHVRTGAGGPQGVFSPGGAVAEVVMASTKDCVGIAELVVSIERRVRALDDGGLLARLREARRGKELEKGALRRLSEGPWQGFRASQAWQEAAKGFQTGESDLWSAQEELLEGFVAFVREMAKLKF